MPVINAVTTSRHLGVSLPTGDWVMAGFDLTCLAGALLLGWMARKAARARKAPAKAGGKAAASTAAPAQVQARPQPDTQAQSVARPRARRSRPRWRKPRLPKPPMNRGDTP